ncbi:MAG: hypothetical protein WBE59_08580 [Candidatus Cybelea sp.]
MSTISSSRHLLSIVVAASLAACGGPQPPIGPSGAMLQTSAIATHGARGKSWMLPEAKSEDLLYVSSDYDGVQVFSYPKGAYVGGIDAFGSGLCSDQKGDVFVTNTLDSQVYEYAHSGTERLQTLYDNSMDFNPFDCSVDPTTGNLAVASVDARFVVVFPNAEQRPKAYYEDMKHVSMDKCAYDDKGNLFVDQIDSHNGRKNYIGELPKGARHFTNYVLDQRISHPGGIQFDGKHIAIEDQDSHVVYRLRFSGTKAILVGSTPLNGTTWVAQYWIQGKTLVGPDENSTVYFWRYPGGGSPVGSIQGLPEPYGVTVSLHD